jgi:hypothetical protein
MMLAQGQQICDNDRKRQIICDESYSTLNWRRCIQDQNAEHGAYLAAWVRSETRSASVDRGCCGAAAIARRGGVQG